MCIRDSREGRTAALASRQASSLDLSILHAKKAGKQAAAPDTKKHVRAAAMLVLRVWVRSQGEEEARSTAAAGDASQVTQACACHPTPYTLHPKPWKREPGDRKHVSGVGVAACTALSRGRPGGVCGMPRSSSCGASRNGCSSRGGATWCLGPDGRDSGLSMGMHVDGVCQRDSATQ